MAIGAAHVVGLSESEGASRQLTAIGRATEWLNSPRLTPEALAGKVVLVQFCTYTCINWLRTLPYVRAWERKYRQQLVVIGVHTPEFAFEHNVDNVRHALQQMKVTYPVVMDNDYAIWRAFDNNSWPALYFVDARGRVRQHHFGEGEYEQSEKTIQRLLAETGGAAVRDGEALRSKLRAWKHRRIGRTCGLRKTTSATSERKALHRLGESNVTGVARMPPLPAWR